MKGPVGSSAETTLTIRGETSQTQLGIATY